MDQDDLSIGRILSRREVLALFGAAGAYWLTPLQIAAGSPDGPAAGQVTAPACVVVPESTEGPYFVDQQLDRSDLRMEPSDRSVKEGAPFALAVNVSQIANRNCTPMAGARVDIWHCDAQGIYSGVRDRNLGLDTVNKKFLRGYQMTDAGGTARFATIFPGWYRGRTIHLHFKIRAAASTGQNYEFTSQFYVDDKLSDQVLAQAPYARGKRDTTNATDRIYRNGGEQLLLAVNKTDQGYAATFAIALDLSDTRTAQSDKFRPPR
jgi:protocatechuate 3,4-dioxygenase beta subunit